MLRTFTVQNSRTHLELMGVGRAVNLALANTLSGRGQSGTFQDLTQLKPSAPPQVLLHKDLIIALMSFALNLRARARSE